MVLERWYFDGDISVVSGRKGGPPLPLASLARRREDWPLMVVSSGFGLPATLTLRDRSWLQAFRPLDAAGVAVADLGYDAVADRRAPGANRGAADVAQRACCGLHRFSPRANMRD